MRYGQFVRFNCANALTKEQYPENVVCVKQPLGNELKFLPNADTALNVTDLGKSVMTRAGVVEAEVTMGYYLYTQNLFDGIKSKFYSGSAGANCRRVRGETNSNPFAEMPTAKLFSPNNANHIVLISENNARSKHGMEGKREKENIPPPESENTAKVDMDMESKKGFVALLLLIWI